MKLNKIEEKIIETIGVTGISRLKELKEHENVKEFSFAEISNGIKNITENGLLKREILKLGGSGKYNFYLLELSETGCQIAETLIGKKPLVSVKKELVKKHGIVEIAYLYEDSKPCLKEKNIYLKRNNDSYSITIDKQTYPILLDAKRDGEKIFSREQYLEMFDSMWEKSPRFFYYSSSAIQSNFLILDEIEHWIKTRNFTKEELESLCIYSSSMDTVFQGDGDKWSTIYELWEDGMLRWGKKPSI